MKTINLTAITYRATLWEDKKAHDVHKDVANAIYTNANTLEAQALALRLWEKGDGDFEVNERELDIIRLSVRVLRYAAQAAILKAIE